MKCTTCVGIGGDPVNGTIFFDTLAAFQTDPDIGGIVMAGEIGEISKETFGL